ncbi:MAG: LEA type 2 family protein [Candidatus Aminicenantaceae bacterium]
MKKKVIFLIVLLMAFVHFSLPASLTKDLKITVGEKRIRDFSLDGLTFVFHVNIANSSSKDYFLSGYEYRFIVNQTDYLQLQTELEEGIRIEARGETLVAFPVKITYENLFRTIPEMKNELHVMCNLIGWARFSDVRRERGKLALAFTGDFPIFWKPELQLVRLQVYTLTIGGADIEFAVKFQNKNRFDLMVDRISYTLTLAGYEIEKGTIAGDKNIDKQGEKLFSLPLLLDFFDVGKEVYNVLNKSSTQSRFFGVVEVQTVWGRLTIPFDKQELLTIKRIP